MAHFFTLIELCKILHDAPTKSVSNWYKVPLLQGSGEGNARHMPAQVIPEGTQVSTFNAGSRKQVHYTFPDQSEMVEEFETATDRLVVRKRREKNMLGKLDDWVYEVGEPPQRLTIENDTLRPSAANPVIVRNDRPHAFEWRIRNLHYPKPTYSVDIDHDERQIVVRTSNKKYFKRIHIPEMDRLRLSFEDTSLTWKHEQSTLIIHYAKPHAVMKMELKARDERIKATEEGGAPALQKDSPECAQQ